MACGSWSLAQVARVALLITCVLVFLALGSGVEVRSLLWGSQSMAALQQVPPTSAPLVTKDTRSLPEDTPSLPKESTLIETSLTSSPGSHPRRCNSSVWKGQWRSVLPLLVIEEKLQVVGDIYEFGVFNGASLNMLHSHFPNTRLWGFDSFKGLPSESGTSDVQNSDFAKGKYAAYMTPGRLIQRLGGPKVVDFVIGFYSKTLTAKLAADRGMSPALYIDIDADLYTSSLQALDWMFASGLVRTGTLIGYDDFWTNPCTRGGESLHPLKTSEGKAHQEVARKYRVKFRCVAGGCRLDEEALLKCGWGAIFIVDELNGETADGFEMSDDEVNKFKKTNVLCRKTHGDPKHKMIR